MPFYCEAGQRARVFFKLNNVVIDNIVADAPVEVSTVNNSAQSGQCCDYEYIVRYTYERRYVNYGYQNPPGAWQGVFSGQHFANPGRVKRFWVESAFGINDRLYCLTENCSGNESLQVVFGDGQYEFRLVTVQIADAYGRPDNCGKADCTFQVKDKDGVVVFKKNYPTCPTYEIACGTNCPDGYIECGGECIPCGEFVKGISALTGRVRNL